MPNNQSNSSSLQHDCIQEEKIENIESDVKELKTKEDSLQNIVASLDKSVYGLKTSVDILKLIFGAGFACFKCFAYYNHWFINNNIIGENKK